MNARRSLLCCVLLALAACGRGGLEPVVFEGGAELEAPVRELIQRCIEAVESAPADAERHAALGLCYEANGLWSRAARSLAQARTLAPKHPDAPLWCLHEAIAQRWSGSLEQERALLEQVVQADPGQPAAWQRLALAHFQAGDFQTARQAFERAHDLMPGAAAPRVGLADVEAALGNWSEAELHAAAALALDPGLSSAHYVRGLALRGLGRDEEAREELAIGRGGGTAFLDDPLSAQRNRYAVSSAQRLLQAQQLLDQGQVGPAAELLAELVEHGVETPVLLTNLASVYIQQGRTSAARALLERSLELDPTYHRAHATQASCSLREGDTERALAEAKSAARAAPRSAHVQTLLGEVHMQRAEYGAAFTAFERALAADPTDASVAARLGTVAALLGRYEDARTYLSRSLYSAPDDVDTRLKLIGALLRLDRRSELLEHLERAAREAPDHPQVRRLLTEFGQQ